MEAGGQSTSSSRRFHILVQYVGGGGFLSHPAGVIPVDKSTQTTTQLPARLVHDIADFFAYLGIRFIDI